MDTKTYKRTQEVLDTLNKVEQLPKGQSIPRDEFLRLLRELHQNLEEMFWAGDFKEKEGESK
ncbi:hypothetical protein [Streptomyces sp. NPDC005096]|uniref:hypothetical protein n=1 Tax=Streptomyces sp. NPDC005096 TaxID=3154559 RepID=UPI0033A84B7A